MNPRLKTLALLPFSNDDLLQEAAARAPKMSIQGVQPKLSAVLEPSNGYLQIVDVEGRYILKPGQRVYPELPENEDLTMRLAASVGIEVPFHGLVRCVDGSLVYVIQRFDRAGRGQRLHVEDFAQLAGLSRDTKYDYSVEKLIKLIDAYCTFPLVEKRRFYLRFIFNYLTGNEDMHLKNYSVLTKAGKVVLSPAYDFLNTVSIYRGIGRPPNEIEESALPLAGKKRKLTRELLVDYLGVERLRIPRKTIERIVNELIKDLESSRPLIDQSFLSPDGQRFYHEVIESGLRVLNG